MYHPKVINLITSQSFYSRFLIFLGILLLNGQGYLRNVKEKQESMSNGDEEQDQIVTTIWMSHKLQLIRLIQLNLRIWNHEGLMIYQDSISLDLNYLMLVLNLQSCFIFILKPTLCSSFLLQVV